MLLSTALFAERRDIVKPKRAVPLDPAHASTVKKRSEDRTPFTSTRPNSVELRRRCSRVKPRVADFCAARADPASGCETGSTFRAPALDDFLSTARRHASSETVRAFAAQVTRLIRSFHEEKQIDGDQSERGTLRAAARSVNTRDTRVRNSSTRATSTRVLVDNWSVLVLDSSFPRATQNQQRIFHCG
jgi:hypothetical protein